MKKANLEKPEKAKGQPEEEKLDEEYEMQFGDDDFHFRIKKNNMIEVKF